MRRPGAFTLVAEAKAVNVPGFVVAEARRKIGHIITIDVVQEARRTGVGRLCWKRRNNDCSRQALPR